MSAQWIDSAEAAARLGVKPATLYAYVSRGLLHPRRDASGRRSRFDPAEVADLRSRTGPPRDGHQLSFTSAITVLGPDRPYFRGRDALELARTSTFETTAELLWSGADDTHVPWQSAGPGLAAATAAQSGLPDGVLPLDRLQLIVTALAIADPMRYTVDPDGVMATGRSLVAGMVEALPPRGRRRVPSTGGIAERLWPRLTARAPDPALVRILDAALTALADHELAASTVAARVCASVRADPYAVVTAGLTVVSGPAHGGASLAAERMLADMAGPHDAARVIGERLRDGAKVPGVGHAIYKNGDGRGELLLELLAAASPRHPALAKAAALRAELETRGLPAVNVDFALATFTTAAGMVTGAGEAIFAIARTVGWLAHALEEYASGTLLRPRATYAGPPISGPPGG